MLTAEHPPGSAGVEGGNMKSRFFRGVPTLQNRVTINTGLTASYLLHQHDITRSLGKSETVPRRQRCRNDFTAVFSCRTISSLLLTWVSNGSDKCVAAHPPNQVKHTGIVVEQANKNSTRALVVPKQHLPNAIICAILIYGSQVRG